ncbi:polysaccharide deacetylase family protein [Marinigracilibium pacificum]|uniref:Polysaccharide deacetylase family protein n=1 Tax=Marinigracilibium pacificum TaxID=2729599 RepID=A0A848J4S2_9BACT|nr:polysaccharide deacetylase family protein [Marinigracilibium pacificum]NMM50716.1 polysaccharide deacetylase family protein [Marinigracilibium pacificum]
MPAFLHHMPNWVRKVYPGSLWQVDTENKDVYLTFDDGPIPEITPWVLDVLNRYNIKATFFMVGDNVRKHPDIFRQVIDHGHLIGNHTFYHKNGFQQSDQEYYDNITKCREIIESQGYGDNLLFRPPYGRLRRRQLRHIIDDGYEVVLWSLLSGDFSPSLEPDNILKKLKKHLSPGSIVVFHDSIKAEVSMKATLEPFINHCLNSGYQFKLIKPVR